MSEALRVKTHIEISTEEREMGLLWTVREERLMKSENRRFG